MTDDGRRRTKAGHNKNVKSSNLKYYIVEIELRYLKLSHRSVKLVIFLFKLSEIHVTLPRHLKFK